MEPWDVCHRALGRRTNAVESRMGRKRRFEMLVLSRRRNQKVIIHKDGEVIAELMVSSVKADKIGLSFVANEDIIIDREEVYIARIRDQPVRT